MDPTSLVVGYRPERQRRVLVFKRLGPRRFLSAGLRGESRDSLEGTQSGTVKD